VQLRQEYDLPGREQADASWPFCAWVPGGASSNSKAAAKSSGMGDGALIFVLDFKAFEAEACVGRHAVVSLLSLETNNAACFIPLTRVNPVTGQLSPHLRHTADWVPRGA